MGTTYHVANCEKQQYFDPGYAGGLEDTKRRGILNGLGGRALAELLLPDAELDFYLESWIGDGLVLVGDECEPNGIAPLKPFQKTPDQDAYHIVTEQFDDITLNLIAQLCKDPLWIERFLELAEEWDVVFINLAHIAIYLHAHHIEIALVKQFGNEWRHRYSEVLKRETAWFPMPYTPRSKHPGETT